MNLGPAVKWTFASVGIKYALKLFGNLTLARLLPAEAFGLASIVLAVISGVEALTDAGTRPALIRSERTDPAWLETAWTLQVTRGLAIGLFVALLSYPIAVFFHDERLIAMIAVTGFMSLLVGLTSNEAVLSVRALNVRTFAFVEASAAILGYVVMLGWAWFAPSAWALLAGALVSTGVFTVLSFIVFPHRKHHFRIDRDAFRDLVRFGKWIFVGSVLGFAILQGDRFAVGKLLSVHDLGVYSIAVTWAGSVQQLFGMFISRLYLPVVSRFRRRFGDFNEATAKLRLFILLSMIVPFGFVAGTAEQVISVLYPGTFKQAGPVMQILMIGTWMAILENLYNDQFLASGRPEWRVMAQTLSVMVLAVCLYLFSPGVGLLAIAAIFASGTVVRATTLLYVHYRHRLSQALPDLIATAAFGLLTAGVAYVASVLTAYKGPFMALVICFVALAPFGAWLLLVAIRSAVRLDPTSIADIQSDVTLSDDKP